MTYLFTPPLTKDRPPILPDSTPDQIALWRHFENRERGVNVFKLQDGSYVQDTATEENSNTNVPYPINFNEPTAPYVRSTYVPASPAPQVLTEVDVSHTNPCISVYLGGHSYEVDDAEAAALTAYTAFGTGYADCLVEQ